MRNQLEVYNGLQEFRHQLANVTDQLERWPYSVEMREGMVADLKDAAVLFDSCMRVGFHADLATESDLERLRHATMTQSAANMCPTH